MQNLLVNFEKYLKSRWYLLTIISIIFIGWHIRVAGQLFGQHLFNTLAMFVIIIIWFVVAVFYENLVYGLPLVMAFSYLINSTDLNLKTFSEFLPLLITAILFIAGIIIHIVRFRRKIKVGRLTLGLTLMATASLIPFIYVKFSISVFLISLVGDFYIF